MRSLRWRLMLLSVGVVLTALTATGFSMRWLFERYLERRINSELSVKIGEIVASFHFVNGGARVDGRLSDMRYEVPLGGAYWQVFSDGVPLLESRSVWDLSLSADKTEISPRSTFERVWPDGSMIYAMRQDVRLFDGDKPRLYTFVVAIDHAEIDAMDAGFLKDALGALAFVSAILLLGSWIQISIGLHPLRQLAVRVAEIKSGREQRLDAQLPLEVEPLAREFNSLLDRQAEAVRRSRERVGALAHGLKTPITILYGKADKLDGDGLCQYAISLRAQLGAMNKHVTRELARARSHGTATCGELHTDARRSVDRLFGLLSRMPRGRTLDFTNAIPEGLIVTMDADDFGEVMGNLLDNARKFAKRRVAVSAVFAADRATILVADDGPGFSLKMREHLLLRGERAVDDVEGSGLGLSIVQDLLADYQTAIIFRNDPDFGCMLGFEIAARLQRHAISML